MGIANKELTDAGWVQQPDGSYSKGQNATHLRPSVPRAGDAGLLDNDTGPAPVVERDRQPGTLGALPAQRANAGRFLVRVTSRRKRLLDEDNLCEKYAVDCCRYAGLIPGDGPGQTKIEVRQEKAEPGAAEEIHIQIFEL